MRRLLNALLWRLHTRTVAPRPGEFPWLYRAAGQLYIAVDGGRFRRGVEIPVTATDLSFLSDQIHDELAGPEYIHVRRVDLAAALTTGTGADNEVARAAARARLRLALDHSTEGAQERPPTTPGPTAPTAPTWSPT